MNKSFLTILKTLCLGTVLLGLLAACDYRRQEYKSCPEVKVIQNTDRLTRFKPGPGRDITDIVLNAELIRADGSCEVSQDSVRANLSIVLRANQGAMNGANSHQLDLIVGPQNCMFIRCVTMKK